MRSYPGYFITLEGVDGGGKTTQIQRLAAWLRGQGREVVLTREPGGTKLGERMRGLVLQVGDIHPVPMAELALIFAARAQHVEEVLLPGLDRGAVRSPITALSAIWKTPRPHWLWPGI